MLTDAEIAQQVALRPIAHVAQELGIADEDLHPYGRYKAKVSLQNLDEDKIRQSKLILVTAITPTKAGIGKTLTSVSLSQGLRKIGKKVVLALREPSLGPCFGMKGGAAGGGWSQVLPMEDINLHFTGDFHAITSANNTLAALMDNYRYFNQGNPESLKTMLFKRVMDVNDRQLRFMTGGLNGSANGIPTEMGFDITPASELMAILCLSKNQEDLRERLANILLGYTYSGRPFFTKDLKVEGALTVLMKDALLPNLVQTIEGGPAFVHGGPFANIAHGCNSLLATKTAMHFGDYVVTEAGFASHLGAEKFMNIKCRIGGIQPAMSVLVATLQGIKQNGGISDKITKEPNLDGLKKGLRDLERHLMILQNFGQNVLVALNRHFSDTEDELAFVRDWCAGRDCHFAVHEGFAKGGDGVIELAQKAVEICEKPANPINFTYELSDLTEVKIHKIISKIYGGDGAELGPKAKTALKKIKEMGLENLPVCMAKTQYSFTDNPAISGLDGGFTVRVDDIVINHGAGFLVAVCGDMMRMPGLPKEPQAMHIDLVDGKIVGLS